MSYVVQLMHVVCTKEMKIVLNQDSKTEMFKYIWGIITNYNCRLYRINGIGNHIHMLIGIHQSVSLMDLMREIKRSSSVWLKDSGKSPNFNGWSREYATFSVSWTKKDRVIEYIRNQEVHHKQVSFDDEFKGLLEIHDVTEYK